ncbi:MAG: chorismate synthase [Elusimicrobia bacterium]|nr:chorismate synthase [Elusimicrobiota bacterium]
MKFSTAGESHGRGLATIIEGIPAGLEIDIAAINADLFRRQQGYGRGARMAIESDKVEVISGIRHGKAMGSPICLLVKNKDFENWQDIMSAEATGFKSPLLSRPRPGHADLAGLIKYGTNDFRNILERASARETAVRVAAGAVFKALLKAFGINVLSFVNQTGAAKLNTASFKNIADLIKKAESSQVRCPDDKTSQKMISEIKRAALKGDTLGGQVTVMALGLPVGLGSHTQWDQKLDGRLAQSLMSVQAVKAVEVGAGTEYAGLAGSKAHDEIFYSKQKGFYRNTNNAGGIEGGISNGEALVVKATMKAIPSLTRPLKSVNIKTKKTEVAEAVRSDVSAVAACAVVCEAAVSFELARALKEKFGGDSIAEMLCNYKCYTKEARKV